MNQTMMLAAAAFMGAFMAAEYKDNGTSASFWVLLVLSLLLVGFIFHRTRLRVRYEAKLKAQQGDRRAAGNENGR